MHPSGAVWLVKGDTLPSRARSHFNDRASSVRFLAPWQVGTEERPDWRHSVLTCESLAYPPAQTRILSETFRNKPCSLNSVLSDVGYLPWDSGHKTQRYNTKCLCTLVTHSILTCCITTLSELSTLSRAIAQLVTTHYHYIHTQKFQNRFGMIWGR